MSSRLLVVVKLRLDLLGQRLAKLNTPLVETVDVPDGTLGEGQVLVVDNQRTQSGRGDLVGQDGRRGAVTKERLVGNKLLGRSLSLDLIRSLADHEGLSLSKEVGGKHLLVLVVVNWVVALGSQDEVGGNELCALVEKLVEGVLCVGGRLTKQNGASRVLDVVAAASNGLSVGLHGQLLEVGGEPVHVLIEAGPSQSKFRLIRNANLRRDKVRLGTKKVRVPDTEQTTNDGNVLLKRSLLEVLVHGVCTSKQLVEVVEANVESNAQTNGTPDTVTSTDPVREAKHVLLVDTELGHLGLVGGESNKVLGNVLLLCALQEP